MRVGFISADWSRSYRGEGGRPLPGGAGWYRIVMPARELSRNGIEVAVGNSFEMVDDAIAPRDLDGAFHDNCDVIVFQRWMSEEAPDVFRRARSAGQFVINDVDDWFFGVSPSNKAFGQMHPKRDSTFNSNHYRHALGSSSALTVSTPYLAERLQKLGVPIYVIRNAIDLSMFHPVPFIPPKPVIGWTGSIAHRSGDLEILRGVLGPFLERHDLRAFHGGAVEDQPSFAELTGIDPGRLTEVGLVPMHQVPDFFTQFDVGIVPLSDVPFNYAKSAIKGMEYAAAGLPFIASSTPEYEWFGEGLLCRRPKDWIRALERLIEPEERAMVGKKALARVRDEDITLRWHDWDDIYRMVMRS